MSKFPCSLTRNMTSHSMENLTFHSLLRWKVIILQIIATSLIQSLFERLGEYTFWAFWVKGLRSYCNALSLITIIVNHGIVCISLKAKHRSIRQWFEELPIRQREATFLSNLQTWDDHQRNWSRLWSVNFWGEADVKSLFYACQECIMLYVGRNGHGENHTCLPPQWSSILWAPVCNYSAHNLFTPKSEQCSGRASFWGGAYTVRKWTRILRTKIRTNEKN